MIGMVLALAAACFWSFSAILARLGLEGGIRTSTGTFISMLSSLLILGTLALVLNFKDVISLGVAALLWFTLVGVVNYVLGRQFNYLAIGNIGVTKASPLFASSPLFSFVLAVIFLGEGVNLALIIGTLTIVIGIYLTVTSQ
ncbi:MAG: DMT family transporter [Dehalococcoidales bacterium]